MSFAFEITADDVANVLRQNSTQVANTRGLPFDLYAEEVFDDLTPEDFSEMESAALAAGDDLIEDQLPAAYLTLRTILVRDGILKH